MSKFDDFIDAVEEGVKELAKKTLKGFKDEATSDVKAFLEASIRHLSLKTSFRFSIFYLLYALSNWLKTHKQTMLSVCESDSHFLTRKSILFKYNHLF